MVQKVEHNFEKPNETAQLRQCTNPECKVWETDYSKTTSCPQPGLFRMVEKLKDFEPLPKRMPEKLVPEELMPIQGPWADVREPREGEQA